MRSGACHWFMPTPAALMMPSSRPDQFRNGPGDRLVHVVVGVVHIDDVHPVQAEPGQAVFQAAPYPGGGIVVPAARRSGTANPPAAISDPEGAGLSSSSRPTLVDRTYPDRGRERSAAPSRDSDSPSP